MRRLQCEAQYISRKRVRKGWKNSYSRLFQQFIFPADVRAWARLVYRNYIGHWFLIVSIIQVVNFVSGKSH